MDSEFAQNIIPVTPVKRLREHSAIFQNGEERYIDSVILCTGYQYSFRFLPESCQPMTTDDVTIRRLSRLFQMTVHVDHPNLFFMGLTKYNPSFLTCNLQAQFVAGVLLGKCSLPSRDAMVADIEEDFRHKLKLGIPITHTTWNSPASYFVKRFQDAILEMSQPDWITPIPVSLLEHFDNYVLAATARPNNFRTRRYPLGMNWKDVRQQNPIFKHMK